MSPTDRDLELRQAIFESFAHTGAPGEHGDLTALAEQHIVVLDDDGRLLMAHPFAAHQDGARVQSGDREWWGNCAWDAFGIVAALDLQRATITAQGITLDVDGDEIHGDAVFGVLVPAARWWDDIGHT
jgi:Alkylmercury lyase